MPNLRKNCSRTPKKKEIGKEELFNGKLPFLLSFLTHKVAKREVPISNDSFDLVELSQMGCIQRLITEDTVDAEVLGRLKPVLRSKRKIVKPPSIIHFRTRTYYLSQGVEHSSADSGRVSTEKILFGLLYFPVVAVTLAAVATKAVYLLHSFHIVFGNAASRRRFYEVET